MGACLRPALLLSACRAHLSRVALSDGRQTYVADRVRERRAKDPNYRVINLGDTRNSWLLEVVDAVADTGDGFLHLQDCWPPGTGFRWAESGALCCKHILPGCFDEGLFTFARCCHESAREPRGPLLRFPMDLADPPQFQQLLDYVKQHGKFDFAFCLHVLQGLSRPQAVLDMLPAIAKAGYIAVPSKFNELADREAAVSGLHYRGSIANRWFFSVRQGSLMAFPKVSFLDADPYFDDFADGSPGVAELGVRWEDKLPYEVLAQDRLGQDVGRVLQLYRTAVVQDDFGRAAVDVHGQRWGMPGRSGEGLSARACGAGAALQRPPSDVTIMTYVSTRRLCYIDAALMLGLSLQRHAPGVTLFALIEELHPGPNMVEVEHALRGAGWSVLLAVPPSHPPNALKGTPVEGVYSKVLMFNPDIVNYYQHSRGLTFNRVLYLDADTWVRSPRIQELLQPNILTPAKPLAAVMDVAATSWHTPGNFNSGVLLFRPDMARFRHIYTILMAGYDADQPAINEAFAGDVVELSPEFNLHGHLAEKSAVSPDDVVVVHFTGGPKPTHADPEHLRKVRNGEVYDQVAGLRGAGSLYAEYFAAMSNSSSLRRLSDALQGAIGSVLSEENRLPNGSTGFLMKMG